MQALIKGGLGLQEEYARIDSRRVQCGAVDSVKDNESLAASATSWVNHKAMCQRASERFGRRQA